MASTILLELTEQQQEQIQKLTNLDVIKLILEFNDSDGSFAVKGAISKLDDTNKSEYEDKAKQMRPCYDYDNLD